MRGSASFHSRRSLSARGKLLNTFAGLVSGSAMALLALGIYLIHDQFVDPIQAPAAGLIVAALLIATSITLLYALLHPARKLRPRVIAHSQTITSFEEKVAVLARSGHKALPWNDRGAPHHSRYVDHIRIRP